jgi:hypothetical protein
MCQRLAKAVAVIIQHKTMQSFMSVASNVPHTIIHAGSARGRSWQQNHAVIHVSGQQRATHNHASRQRT